MSIPDVSIIDLFACSNHSIAKNKMNADPVNSADSDKENIGRFISERICLRRPIHHHLVAKDSDMQAADCIQPHISRSQL